MTACSAACGYCGRCTAAWDDSERDEQDERDDDMTPADLYEDELAMREDYEREDR